MHRRPKAASNIHNCGGSRLTIGVLRWNPARRCRAHTGSRPTPAVLRLLPVRAEMLACESGGCAGPSRQLRPNPDRGNGRRAPALAKVVFRPSSTGSGKPAERGERALDWRGPGTRPPRIYRVMGFVFRGSCRPVEVRSAEAYAGALRPSSRNLRKADPRRRSRNPRRPCGANQDQGAPQQTPHRAGPLGRLTHLPYVS